MKKLNAKRMVVVDLYAGSYNKRRTGHELFNLTKNPIDGYFYGYCPPWDGIAITKLGAKSGDKYVNDILVVYVAKKDNSNNREIIAFCLNAKVFKTGQSGVSLSRDFIEKDGEERVSSFSIKSDNLYNLTDRFNKFEIKIQEYSNYMFRKQRFYGGTYPDLDKLIIAFIENVLENKVLLDNDDNEEQEEIQRAEPASAKDVQESAHKPLCIVDGHQGKAIAKDRRISKAALVAANYTCIISSEHKTFRTKQNKPYMEGHHLIPCTVSNSEYFISKFNKNIDCFENIVCICPTCHREVHYGGWNGKSGKIKMMLKKQKEKLDKVGLLITEEELLKLYKGK